MMEQEIVITNPKELAEGINLVETRQFVHSHDVQLDGEYTNWLIELKQRYRAAQFKAAVKVNAEKLLFNWQLGRDLVQKKADEKWGAGVVEQLSLDLKAEFPAAEGFSARNLWLMKQLYLYYTQNQDTTKLQQAVAEIQAAILGHPEKLLQIGGAFSTEQKVQQLVAEFPEPFAYVPWGHHTQIIQKCKTVDEALYYIRRTIQDNWSREALVRAIKANVYLTQGNAISNYATHLPAIQGQMVQDMVKSNYNFSFATVPYASYDETDLENALEQNITRFILELGNGFAFIGRQQEIPLSGKDRKVDLLFYHIRQRRYVVVELKAVPFEPEFVSKLNFYVNATDALVREEGDNQTVGILICSDMNETEVKWSFEGISTPLAVATYSDLKIQELLPIKEQIRERVHQLENELKQLRKLTD